MLLRFHLLLVSVLESAAGLNLQSSSQVVRSQQNLLTSETQVMLLTRRPQQLVTIVGDQKRQRFIEQEWGYLNSFFLEADTCWMLAVPKLWSGIWSMPFPSTNWYTVVATVTSYKWPLLRSFVSTSMYQSLGPLKQYGRQFRPKIGQYVSVLLHDTKYN